MNRFTLLQKLIEKIDAKTYLEIGVRDGVIIKDIKAKYKFGVDPEFSFNKIDKIKYALNLLNFKAIKLLSDDFFARPLPAALNRYGIDVAFVDGLHKYEQSLKDVYNCLRYLNEDGFIVMHDCNPISYAGAYPIKESIEEVFEMARKGELEGWDHNWNGDVWKALVHLRIAHDDLEIFTLDADWGLGVIRKRKSEKLKALSLNELKNADYYTLEKNREELLNLKSPEYLQEYLSSF